MKNLKYKLDNIISSLPMQQYLDEYRDESKFIGFCKQCDRYNRCWSCPPFEFNVTELIQKYNNIGFLATKIVFNVASSSLSNGGIDNKHLIQSIIAEVRGKLDIELLELEKTLENSYASYAGTCYWCPKESCTRIDNKPCRFPDKIRPSLESFGFDIGKTTTQLLGVELKWSKNGELPEYLVLVSAMLSNASEDVLQKHLSKIIL